MKSNFRARIVQLLTVALLTVLTGHLVIMTWSTPAGDGHAIHHAEAHSLGLDTLISGDHLAGVVCGVDLSVTRSPDRTVIPVVAAATGFANDTVVSSAVRVDFEITVPPPDRQATLQVFLV